MRNIDELNVSSLLLTRHQRGLLKKLVESDISDWQSMSMRPISEVGLRMPHLAQAHIHSMREILAKLDLLDSIDTIQQVFDSCLLPEVELSYKNNDITVVIHGF